jgi:hypothetical protein
MSPLSKLKYRGVILISSVVNNLLVEYCRLRLRIRIKRYITLPSLRTLPSVVEPKALEIGTSRGYFHEGPSSLG